jgi:hypothetical protein
MSQDVALFAVELLLYRIRNISLKKRVLSSKDFHLNEEFCC